MNIIATAVLWLQFNVHLRPISLLVYLLDVRIYLKLTFGDLFLLPAGNVNSIRQTGWYVCLKTLSHSTLARIADVLVYEHSFKDHHF